MIGPKPVVLIFGNFTCGPFRSQAGNFEKLHRRYGDRATFVMVYVREAHPTDGWRMQSNERVGVATPQPQTYGERAVVAQQCGKRLGLGFPMLVDTIDDAVGARYSGMPGRFYLIDKAGKIAFKNAPRPVRLQAGRAGAVAHPDAPGRRLPDLSGDALIDHATLFLSHLPPKNPDGLDAEVVRGPPLPLPRDSSQPSRSPRLQSVSAKGRERGLQVCTW